MTEEYVDYAGRSEPRERWLKAAPLLIAGVLGIPLSGFAIYFSRQIAQVAKYMFDLATSGWDLVGIVLLSLSGAFCVIAFLVCLFIGSRRRTWRWRIGWAVAAFLAAGAVPIWALLDWLINGGSA